MNEGWHTAGHWRELSQKAVKLGLMGLGQALLPGVPVVGRALGMAASELVTARLGDLHTDGGPVERALKAAHEDIEARGEYGEIRLPKNFTYRELAERHTGLLEPPDVGEFQAAVDALQELRDAYGRPMRLTSAWRSLSHPAEASKPPDALHRHFHGAFDVACHGPAALSLLRLALEQGWTGIGVNARGPFSQRFLHLDRVHSHSALWGY